MDRFDEETLEMKASHEQSFHPNYCGFCDEAHHGAAYSCDGCGAQAARQCEHGVFCCRCVDDFANGDET